MDKMTLIKKVKEKYRTQRAAAAALGVSDRHLRRWFAEPDSIPDWRKEWLEYKVNGSK